MPSVPLSRLAASLLPLLLSACAAPPPRTAPGPAAQDAADVRIERIDREFDLPRGVTRVAIDNPWGEINVRGREEHEVGMHAVIQRLPPRFAKPEFRSHREGDTLHIDIAFAGEPAGAQARAGRVDAAVYLPSQLAIALRARDSRIAANKRAGAIEATTDSGPIIVSSRDRLVLHSRSGQIRAIAFGARWNGASEIESETGPIMVLVPTFGDITLHARTGGKLTTNFGLSVHRRDDVSESHARYGAGTSALSVRSTSGDIELEQMIRLGDDRTLPEDDD